MCYGCQEDCPGQRDHMAVGCLTDWSELVQNYLPIALERVSTEQVREVLTKLYRALNIPADPLMAPIIDFYLCTHILDAECMLEMDIPDIIREKLHDFVKELYM